MRAAALEWMCAMPYNVFVCVCTSQANSVAQPRMCCVRRPKSQNSNNSHTHTHRHGQAITIISAHEQYESSLTFLNRVLASPAYRNETQNERANKNYFKKSIKRLRMKMNLVKKIIEIYFHCSRLSVNQIRSCTLCTYPKFIPTVYLSESRYLRLNVDDLTFWVYHMIHTHTHTHTDTDKHMNTGMWVKHLTCSAWINLNDSTSVLFAQNVCHNSELTKSGTRLSLLINLWVLRKNRKSSVWKLH